MALGVALRVELQLRRPQGLTNAIGRISARILGVPCSSQEDRQSAVGSAIQGPHGLPDWAAASFHGPHVRSTQQVSVLPNSTPLIPHVLKVNRRLQL